MSSEAYQPLRVGERVRWVEAPRAAAKPRTRDGTIVRIVGEGRKAAVQVRADGGALLVILAADLRRPGESLRMARPREVPGEVDDTQQGRMFGEE